MNIFLKILSFFLPKELIFERHENWENEEEIG